MTTEANRQQATAAPALDAAELRRHENQARTDAVRAEFRHELDVAYGPHPRQVLDIYYPKQATAAPVMVFLHGGGFRAGAPGANGYNGRAILEHGGIFVSMGYRLVPDAKFPDSCEDVELGLQWLRDQIAERGGDPGRIYLSGHSAGAMLAAMVGLRSWPPGVKLPSDLIKGLVLISGPYEFTDPRVSEVANVDSKRYVPSMMSAVDRTPPRAIVVVGDNDLPGLMSMAEALVEAIKARGGSVEMFVEAEADHFAANKGFISPDGAVFQATERMMQLGS